MKAQKVWVLFLAMALVVFGFGAMAQAGDTATQIVTFDVQAINEITVSGPVSLTISTATAGDQPDSDTDDTTTYNITTNEKGKKITAKIDSNMPTGTTLKVNLTAPTAGGSSVGDVTLGTSDADVVNGIGQVAESNLPITYTFSATVSAGVVPSGTRTVTFTLITE